MRRRLCRFPRPSIKRDYVGKHFIQVLLHAHRHSNTGTTFSSRPLYPQPYINYILVYTIALLYSTTTSKEDTFRLYYVRNDLTQHAVRLMFAPTGGRSAFKRIISTNAVMLLLHWCIYNARNEVRCARYGFVMWWKVGGTIPHTRRLNHTSTLPISRWHDTHGVDASLSSTTATRTQTCSLCVFACALQKNVLLFRHRLAFLLLLLFTKTPGKKHVRLLV